MTAPVEPAILFRNDAPTPLGRLSMAALLNRSTGIPTRTMRVIGTFSLTYIFHGNGQFRDGNGYAQKISAGDLIFLFPDVPHNYGPARGDYWSDFHIFFDGPAFDLWQQVGLLDPAHPILHLEPIDEWLKKFQEVATPRTTLVERTLAVQQLLNLLTEISATVLPASRQHSRPDWLAYACTWMSAWPDRKVDFHEVARHTGMSYGSFREQFRRHMGMAPAHYHAVRRIDVACELLQRTGKTQKEIAAQLGFPNEYHFSRRFKQITGLSPRRLRQQLPQNLSPETTQTDAPTLK